MSKYGGPCRTKFRYQDAEEDRVEHYDYPMTSHYLMVRYLPIITCMHMATYKNVCIIEKHNNNGQSLGIINCR